LSAKSSPPQKRCKHVDFGGVHYEIVVDEFDDYYRAEWTCDNCGESGAWAPISATPDGAMELAKLALRIHHSLVHGGPSRPLNLR
jgi:hypothetical protein